jgi:hypothetical protein
LHLGTLLLGDAAFGGRCREGVWRGPQWLLGG